MPHTQPSKQLSHIVNLGSRILDLVHTRIRANTSSSIRIHTSAPTPSPTRSRNHLPTTSHPPTRPPARTSPPARTFVESDAQADAQADCEARREQDEPQHEPRAGARDAGRAQAQAMRSRHGFLLYLDFAQRQRVALKCALRGNGPMVGRCVCVCGGGGFRGGERGPWFHQA